MINYLLIFLFGLCIGSFLGVLIYREANEESPKPKAKSSKFKKHLPSWIAGRSYCDHCHQTIRWHDNIPLLSYILLNGRCRFCRYKIPRQYPLLELLTGIEFVWIYWLVANNLMFLNRFEGFYSIFMLIFWLAIGAVFLLILISDLKYQIIPDSGIVLGILSVLGRIYFEYWYTGYLNWSFIPAAIGGSLFFMSIIWLTKGKGMGFGDVKLVFLIGLLLGFPNILVALFVAFLTGAFVGVILILLKTKTLKQAIAFGPFLILGTGVALIWGKIIVNWYLGQF